MSGGSLDYAEYKINQIAEDIRSRARTPLHRAFAKHLDKCAEAAHALEWMFSGDTGEGTEIAPIKAVVKPKAALQQTIDEAHQCMKELRQELETACSGLYK